MTESQPSQGAAALSKVWEAYVFGILKARNLARILSLILCPCLLGDSPSELQKAQGLLANGFLAEAVRILSQSFKTIRAARRTSIAWDCSGIAKISCPISQRDRDRDPFVANSATAHNQLGVI